MTTKKKRITKKDFSSDGTSTSPSVSNTPHKFPRELPEEDFQVRDLGWAVGVICTCGKELDFFNRFQPHEMVCSKCNRYYSVKLVGYEVEKPQ